MGPGMMHGAPGPGFADAEDIDELKAELGITPAQEPAWSKYVKVVQDATAAMKTTREGVDPQAVSKMSPADRFAFVSKMREQGEKQLEAVKTAANELAGHARRHTESHGRRHSAGSHPVRPRCDAWRRHGRPATPALKLGGLAPPSSPLGAPAARGQSMLAFSGNPFHLRVVTCRSKHH